MPTPDFEVYVVEEKFTARQQNGEVELYVTGRATGLNYLVYLYTPAVIEGFARSTARGDVPCIVIPNPVFVKDLEVETIRAAFEYGIRNYNILADMLPIDFLTEESKQRKLSVL